MYYLNVSLYKLSITKTIDLTCTVKDLNRDNVKISCESIDIENDIKPKYEIGDFVYFVISKSLFGGEICGYRVRTYKGKTTISYTLYDYKLKTKDLSETSLFSTLEEAQNKLKEKLED